jgi:hypothetical protein
MVFAFTSGHHPNHLTLPIHNLFVIFVELQQGTNSLEIAKT